jgi:hypothetical protein
MAKEELLLVLGDYRHSKKGATSRMSKNTAADHALHARTKTVGDNHVSTVQTTDTKHCSYVGLGIGVQNRGPGSESPNHLIAGVCGENELMPQPSEQQP